MNSQLVLELVGYVASILVAISLMMSSILKLRLINLVGSAAFVVYGALIGAYPVAVVNLLSGVLSPDVERESAASKIAGREGKRRMCSS